MIDPEKRLTRVEQTSWDDLRGLAEKELDTIPINDRIVFEAVFRRNWEDFRGYVLDLAGQDFQAISKTHNRLAMFGDLDQSEVVELTALAVLNSARYRSAKLEYYLVTRLLHTRPKGVLGHIREVLAPLL